MVKLIIVAIATMLFFPTLAYAEPQIFTTYRNDGNDTVWDGKWTFLDEWKRTTDTTTLYSDENSLSVRVGHDYKYLYVFLDFVTQHEFEKQSDYGLVCITANQTLESQPQDDDYCFQSHLGSSMPITFQGGGNLALTDYFVKIKNDPTLIAVGGISDANDRYSPVPHTGYEFRIPINNIGRNDLYQFYVAVYNAHDGLSYSWPENITKNSFPDIPPPTHWGQLVSPDKSLPEFPFPMIVLPIALSTILLLARFGSCRFTR